MLRLRIVTPTQVVFDGQVDNVTVPGTAGEFEILSDHAPIISSLEEGNVRYTVSGQPQAELAICGGFVEVNKNVVSLCVETEN